MAYRFKCGKCEKELVVKWLKPGETAKCRKCGADVKVPANAAEVRNEYAPLPELESVESLEKPETRNCPACRFLEKLDAGEFEESLPLGTYGACHRYPPAAEGRYPFVTQADWCGEYEGRD